MAEVMKDTEILARVVELAKENVANGGWPFSTVIAKDGEIIAEAVNSVHKSNDPSDHAEIAAIRKATKKLGSPNLSGHTLYLVAPPCPMCNTCMILANIEKVVYIVDIDNKDKALSSLPLTNGLYQALQNGFEVKKMGWQQDSQMLEDAVSVLKDWNRNYES